MDTGEKILKGLEWALFYFVGYMLYRHTDYETALFTCLLMSTYIRASEH